MELALGRVGALTSALTSCTDKEIKRKTVLKLHATLFYHNYPHSHSSGVM